MKPTLEQNLNLAWSVARVRLEMVQELHAEYGKAIDALVTKLRDRERRIRLARAWLSSDSLSAFGKVRTAKSTLDLRRPLRKGRR